MTPKIFMLGASNMEKLWEIVIKRAIPMGVAVVSICKKIFWSIFFSTLRSRPLFNPALRTTSCLLIALEIPCFHNLHPNLLNGCHSQTHHKQTHQTPVTSNPRHIKPQIINIGLPITQQINIRFHSSIEILFENLKIN